MNQLQTDQFSFGRHETFPLRYGWLTKGYTAWSEDQSVFEGDDAVVTLGVGKNMVNAIRYWLLASQAVTVADRKMESTKIGKRLFAKDGWDPFLEDDTTIWLIHWLIASNAAWATSPFWFFNRFHKPEFTSRELQDSLSEFISENFKSRATASTIKHDVALLMRMYVRTTPAKDEPLEESLDSPLSTLGLVHRHDGSRFHESKPDVRSKLPIAAFAFAVAEIFEELDLPSISVEQIVHSDGKVASPGSVFRLSEEGVVAKIEEMISWQPKVYELRSTAGLNQVYRLQKTEPLEVLKKHYASQRGAAR